MFCNCVLRPATKHSLCLAIIHVCICLYTSVSILSVDPIWKLWYWILGAMPGPSLGPTWPIQFGPWYKCGPHGASRAWTRGQRAIGAHDGPHAFNFKLWRSACWHRLWTCIVEASLLTTITCWLNGMLAINFVQCALSHVLSSSPDWVWDHKLHTQSLFSPTLKTQPWCRVMKQTSWHEQRTRQKHKRS